VKLIASDGLETGESELNFLPFVSLSLAPVVYFVIIPQFPSLQTVNLHFVVVVGL
jgi:hypothetical protein